jgi:hypothetical protein
VPDHARVVSVSGGRINVHLRALVLNEKQSFQFSCFKLFVFCYVGLNILNAHRSFGLNSRAQNFNFITIWIKMKFGYDMSSGLSPPTTLCFIPNRTVWVKLRKYSPKTINQHNFLNKSLVNSVSL